MSSVTKPIMLDETGKAIASALHQQNALLSAMARGSVNALASNLKDILAIVREGHAAEIFHVGDQIIVPWKDVAADVEYEVPLDIVHFGNVTRRDGAVVPAMFLQWHYCSPFGVQFDHQENEVATETAFLTDYSYYEAYTASDGNTRYKLLVPGTDYSIGANLPTNKTLYHSGIKDSTGYIVNYGYNRWSHSALRQFLNSKKGIGEWWTAQHLGDVAPNELATKAGFMSGFGEDFLACVQPIKVTTALNTVTDSDIGTTEDTYDTFFLPSLEQIHAKRQLAGEGEVFEYWKQATGSATPIEWHPTINPAYITYAINAKSSAQSVRLRSANRYNSYHTWHQSSTGYTHYNYANGASRFAPVCAFC